MLADACHFSSQALAASMSLNSLCLARDGQPKEETGQLARCCTPRFSKIISTEANSDAIAAEFAAGHIRYISALASFSQRFCQNAKPDLQ